MNLLYILNEYQYGAHIDVHKGLERLKKEGYINNYTIYPFLFKISQGLSIEDICSEIVEQINKIEPDAIIWSHTSGLKISDDFLKKLKSEYPKIIHLYFDGDIYQKFYKPLPREVIKLAGFCNVSFWPGYAEFVKELKKEGCKDIRYIPLTTDEIRFAKTYQLEHKYDVIMIGNYITSRIPFKTWPGSRLRKSTAEFLYKKYDDKFAIYGNGWEGKRYAKGEVPFEKQGELYNWAKVSVGVNNLHADYYFSNRLPIAMSSGKIMIHNYEKGIEKIFNDIKYPYFFKDKEELSEILENLLKKSEEELISICSSLREYALNKLTMYSAIKYMTEVAKEKIDNHNIITTNPWLKEECFN
ncbi:MAG: glycosyltransferase [Bacteroidota bacterium]|nr:glycosyltransferase [Bacteroidota bacterium]